jgi:neuroligin
LPLIFRILSIYFLDNNKTLAPRYDIGWKFFDTMVRDHITQYNYTLNPEGIFGAIKYMYTYYPDPNNRSHIREEFINVSVIIEVIL